MVDRAVILDSKSCGLEGEISLRVRDYNTRICKSLKCGYRLSISGWLAIVLIKKLARNYVNDSYSPDK